MKTYFRFAILAIAIFGLVGLPGCTSTVDEDDVPDLPVPNERKNISLSRSEEEILNTQNEFSLNLFKYYIDKEKGCFVSPLSASMAMSLLANATAGETQREILDVLGFGEADIDAANALIFRLGNELAAVDNTVNLSLANSVWFDYRLDVKQLFIERAAASYGAEFFTVDLYSNSSVDAINQWCSEKTKGLIPEFLQRAPEGLFCLYNATYFNGRWSTPFEKSKTRKEQFHNLDGSHKNTDMMHGLFNICYNETDGIQIVRIPYGNGAYEMVVFVSADNHDIRDYMKSLTADQLKSRINTAGLCKVNLKMPKFNLENTMEMNDFFGKYGVKRIFDLTGDFSPLTDGQCYTNKIKQKTHIIVEEKGTEAAAVTGIHNWGASLSGAEAPTVDVTVDHPFAYIIRECSTGAYLFMGCITDCSNFNK